MADHAKRTTRLVSFRRHCGRPRFVSQAGLPKGVWMRYSPSKTVYWLDAYNAAK
jgi:hypothetical protein